MTEEYMMMLGEFLLTVGILFTGFSIIAYRRWLASVPRDGMKARWGNYDLRDNPFRRYTPEHVIWRNEWLDSGWPDGSKIRKDYEQRQV